MATNTTNYGLTKPASNDYVQIDTINNNMDILDTELKKIENSIPTTLPANGGNADTLDNKHATDFFSAETVGHAKCLTGIDYNTLTETGLYEVIGTEESPTTNYPILPTGNEFVMVFKRSTATIRQVVFNARGTHIIRTRAMTSGTWGSWVNVNDGGNADTVDGYHANQLLAKSINQIPNNNLNDIVETGFYEVRPNGSSTPTTNTPYDGWGTCLHINHSSLKQQIVFFTSDIKPLTYRRTYTGVAWTSWREVGDGGNADTVDGYHVEVRPQNYYGLRAIAMDTFDIQAGVTPMPVGQIYIQYE